MIKILRKKNVFFFALLLALSFNVAFAQDMEREIQAIKMRIQNIDLQIKRAKAAKNFARIANLQKQKQALIEKAQNLKASSQEFDQSFAPSSSSQKTEAENISDISDSTSIDDVKEDMNKAIAELRNQIEAVKKENSDAKVGGEIRFDWVKGLENNASVPYNKFDISRAYIDIKKKLSGGASARITLDVARISGASSQNLFDYLKYAYIDLPVDLSKVYPPLSMTAKLGLQHTVWIDWSGKIWRFENILKAYSDLNKNSISSSADFGLGAAGKLTLQNLPEIEYHATVLNGKGYNNPEDGTPKDVAIRLNSDVAKTPLGTVVLAGYIGVKNGLFTGSSSTSTQSGGLVAIKNEDFGNLYFEYQNDQKSNKPVNGYSIGGFVYPSKELIPAGFLARYDMYDPDTTTSNNEQKTTVLGVFYDWTKDVVVSVDYQSSKTGTGAEAKTIAFRGWTKF